MTTIPKLIIYKSIILGILTVFIGISTHLFVPSNLESNLALDTLFKIRGTAKAPPEAVVIAIDKVASTHYGFENEPLAWTRDYHAKIINALHQAGAQTIVFDIFFKRPRNKKNDDLMALAIKKAGNVILFSKLNRQLLDIQGQTPRTLNQDNILSIETIQEPTKLLTEAALATAPFTLPKYPAKVSQFWTFRTTSGDTPTLPLIALHHYINQSLNLINGLPEIQNLETTNLSLVQQIKQLREYLLQNKGLTQKPLSKSQTQKQPLLNNLISAYTQSPQPYINFYGPPRTITTFTYDQVLENRLPENFSFKNKVVFIGFSEKLEPEQKDNFYTVFSQPNGLDLSGIEIAATAFLNLLHNSSIKPITSYQSLTIIIIFGFIIALVSRLFRETSALLLWLFVASSYLFIAFYQFEQNYYWLPLVVPLLIQAPFALIFGISWYALDNYRSRKKMRRAFSYYVPETMVDLLTEQKQPIQQSQELQYGVCMATDAEQYTQLSEKLAPEDLATLMNQYYETLFSCVRDTNGTVSDIIGDAMLALWLPQNFKNKSKLISSENNFIELRIKSCLTALEIIKSHSKQYNVNQEKFILPTRIGIHAGDMMIGNVGAVDHYEYRAVGDVINTTTRIENLNKRFNTYLLASKEVVSKTNLFHTRNIGSFILSGKQQSITLYEILKLSENVTIEDKHKTNEFHQALSFFNQGLFVEAEKAFNLICTLNPTDGVARFYLQQSQQQSTMQPNDDWDGTIKFTMK